MNNNNKTNQTKEKSYKWMCKICDKKFKLYTMCLFHMIFKHHDKKAILYLFKHILKIPAIILIIPILLIISLIGIAYMILGIIYDLLCSLVFFCIDTFHLRTIETILTKIHNIFGL